MTGTLEPPYDARNDTVCALRRRIRAGRSKRFLLLILSGVLVLGGALVLAFGGELYHLSPQVADVHEVPSAPDRAAPASRATAGLRGTLSDLLPASDTKLALRGTLFSSNASSSPLTSATSD